MMRKNSILASFLLLALLACSKNPSQDPEKSKRPDPSKTSILELCEEVQEQWDKDQAISRIYIVAHRANTYRSYRAGIPDNSLPNIAAAIEAGADMVELDVRTTKDGEFVLMHNATIDETTTGTGSVTDLTLAKIKSYDMKKAGKVYTDEQGQKCQVPTLTEALLACKNKIYVNLDIAGKNNNLKKLVDIIVQCGMQDQVMLYCGSSSSDYSELQAYNPLVAIHPQISTPNDAESYKKSYLGARLFQYGYLIYYNNTIQAMGTQIHLKGCLSYSNLLNFDSQLRDKQDYTALDRFIASGSDFVQTDICELVDEYLKTKGLR